jgi:hypothetical protein
MMLDDEGGTKVERQAVCSVDDEEEDAQATSLSDGALLVHFMSRVDERIITAGEGRLGAKGVGGTNGCNDFLGKSSSASTDSLEGKLHICGDELVHERAGDTNARQNRRDRQSKSPRADECHYEEFSNIRDYCGHGTHR